MSAVSGVKRGRGFYESQSHSFLKPVAPLKKPKWEKVTNERRLDKYVPGTPSSADRFQLEEGEIPPSEYTTCESPSTKETAEHSLESIVSSSPRSEGEEPGSLFSSVEETSKQSLEANDLSPARMEIDSEEPNHISSLAEAASEASLETVEISSEKMALDDKKPEDAQLPENVTIEVCMADSFRNRIDAADDLFHGQKKYREAEACYRKLLKEFRATLKAVSISVDGWPIVQLEWKLSQVLLEIIKKDMSQFNYASAISMIEEALQLACCDHKPMVASRHIDELNERLTICRSELQERELRARLEDELEELAFDKSTLSGTLHQLADEDLANGNYKKALVVLQDALKDDPENENIKQKIELCNDEIEKAKQNMTTGERLQQTLLEREKTRYLDAQVAHELADHQMARGDYRSAFFGLQKTLNVEPGKPVLKKKLKICSSQIKKDAYQALQTVRDFSNRRQSGRH